MQTAQTSKINNPHDKFFKSVFSKKEVVAEFIEKLMIGDVSKQIDLDSLVLDNSEYIDDELKNHYSDMVYQCDYLKDNNQPIKIKIALLFEHKSYPEKHPHLQLLRYFLNIWELQIKQTPKQKLMPVIPIIIYHGTKRWHQQPITDYFSDIDDALKQFIPSFDYLLLDTSKYDNQYFKQLNQAELQYGILAMKHVFNMAQFIEDITEILANIDTFISTEAGRKFFKTMLIYLYQYSDLTFEQWEHKMQTVSPQAKQQFVSTYDQAIATGMEKGIQQGIEKGILTTAKNLKEMNLDVHSIAKATGLSVDEINNL